VTEPGGMGRVPEDTHVPADPIPALRGVHLGCRVVQDGGWDLGVVEVTGLAWRGGSTWEATLADGRVVNVCDLEVVEECRTISYSSPR
jgi:hypothetical protein